MDQALLLRGSRDFMDRGLTLDSYGRSWTSVMPAAGRASPRNRPYYVRSPQRD